MKIEINIEKKHLYVISALLVLVVVAVGAFAAVGNPKVFHEFLPVKHIQAISPSNTVIVDDDLSVQGNVVANTVEADTIDATGGGIVLPDDTVLGSAQDIANLVGTTPPTVFWKDIQNIPGDILDGDQVGVSGCQLSSRQAPPGDFCNANEVASTRVPCGGGTCFWCMSITCS